MGIQQGAQALRVSLLWRSSADGTIDFENASSQFQKLACRMYVIATYGIAGPATMLLLLALIRIALAANDSGSSARGFVAGTLVFMLPVAAAQALITYIDTTPAFGDTRDQMLRGLPTYFIDVYISNARPGRMTDANAQCSWGEHRYYPLAGEACVACIVPLFATIVAAISIAVYAVRCRMKCVRSLPSEDSAFGTDAPFIVRFALCCTNQVCMATLTSHVESSVINYRLRSRVKRLQRMAFVGLVFVVGTGGASLLFKPGTLVYESVMLAHIFGVLCSCAASVWLLWPQQKSADIILSVVMGSYDDDDDSDGNGHDGNATDREAMESARGSGCHADGGGDGTDIGRAASDGSSADDRL